MSEGKTCSLRMSFTGWIRQHLTVVGERTVLELRGIACLPLVTKAKPRKGLMHARSFGRPLEVLEELEEAVASYTARVAEKLRQQGSVAASIQVFLHTNPFQPEQPQYANEATRSIHFPTAFPPDLIGHAIALLRGMYRQDYTYKKAGVFLTRITPEKHLQCDLFGEVTVEQQQKQVRLMQAVDTINHLWGQDTIYFGAQIRTRAWQMRQERRSPRYTTHWQELLEVSG